ncbi:Rab family GTPase [Cochleicola gelatinilyticus]|uniref:GTP-binding protein n=1 Tax=Cochleicola gelatinilyticus TaxID=1763537 RepID=A0A167J815_9FLAO|nr:Rab family GTPase [Cochleicola gelatinilyticus]OAB80412.1 hypothetical protein ULVI_06665 [Cochleicola gelatinilyticus]
MPSSKKIVMLGHFGVGKTSLVRRYVDSAFSEDYLVTLGVQVKSKEVNYKGETIKLIIWDIEGNTSLDLARKSYLMGSQGFVYVFDVTRPETFNHLQSELDFLGTNYSKVPYVLVGNKKDLISSDQIQQQFSDNIFQNTTFTSAKEGENVESFFLDLLTQLI